MKFNRMGSPRVPQKWSPVLRLGHAQKDRPARIGAGRRLLVKSLDGVGSPPENPGAVYSCTCLAGAERALAISAPIKRIMSAVFIPIPLPAH
jgi:hypothetical protein